MSEATTRLLIRMCPQQKPFSAWEEDSQDPCFWKGNMQTLNVTRMQAADEMDGSERELLPGWVKDAVLQSHFPQLPELKAAFLLIPVEVWIKSTRMMA